MGSTELESSQVVDRRQQGGQHRLKSREREQRSGKISDCYGMTSLRLSLRARGRRGGENSGH